MNSWKEKEGDEIDAKMTDIAEIIMTMTGIAKIVSARKIMPAILCISCKNTTIAIMGGTVRMDIASRKIIMGNG